jgi:hypothetical protein
LEAAAKSFPNLEISLYSRLETRKAGRQGLVLGADRMIERPLLAAGSTDRRNTF